jgi:sodium transport system permease protein
MNWSLFRLLYVHEMRLLLRARRTIVLSVLLPALVMPIMLLASKYSNEQRDQTLAEATYKFAIVGPLSVRVRGLIERTRNLHSTPPHQFKFAEILTEDPVKALENGDIQFYIRTRTGEEADRLPDAPKERLVGVPMVTVVYRGNQDISNNGRERIVELLELARQGDTELALAQHGFAGNSHQLFLISTTNLATGGQVSGLSVGRLITAILVMLMLTGGSVAALDIIAGEKERGTLETLLTTAAGRTEIVAAKQFAISSVALAITVIQALNFFLYIKLRVINLPAGFQLELSSSMAITLLLLFAPLAMTLGSVLLMLSAYAKSYKEAHLYFFPVYLLSLLLSLTALLPGIPLRSAIAIVPIANVSVAAREILVGRPDLPMILLTFLVMVGVASWLMRTARQMLSREDIILPAHAEPAEFIGGKALFGKRVLRWFALLWAVEFAAAANIPALASLQRQIVFNEIVLMLGASIFIVRIYKLDLRETLSLRAVKPVVWLAIICAIPTANSAAVAVFRLANIFVPVSEELLRNASENLIPPGMPQWQLFIFLALLPAICEEIAFRGILLSGLRQRLRPVALTITVGLIFGLFHMTLFRIAPTAVLGVILTAIAVLTGSIFPGMLLHMGNNAWGVWAGLHDLDADTLGPWHSAAMITIFALSMWIIYRNRVRPGMSHTSSWQAPQIRSEQVRNESGRRHTAD